ncbi:hypothetical protein niasHS_002386 [Heterodera schachtii]|uniref:BolA-like protein n=2 Tax=Heterodera TaxID=34509 RepID=A0ABD2KJT5_HETSC
MNAFCSAPSEGPVTIELRQKIVDFFKPEHLEVECESRLHNVPKGAEKHFRVQIVSDKFNGMTQLHRQRMVNKLLAEELREKIHALRIEAKIPSEWHGTKQTPAPPCEGGEKKRRQMSQKTLKSTCSFRTSQKGACEDGASSGARRRAEEAVCRAPQAVDCGGPKGPRQSVNRLRITRGLLP